MKELLKMSNRIQTNKCLVFQSDCARIPLADQSVDLVFCSPPYEAQRSYGIGFALRGQEWVNWALDCYMECLRVCRGLVAWVVDGHVSKYRWSASPALLMADLHRAGVHLRRPPLYVRHGIPGTGGPDWLANKYEFIICATKNGGRLPWSDNIAMGHPPKYGSGGNCSHRTVSGKVASKRYKQPKLANPGNLINCGAVGGGNIGSKIAHLNEAPFPEKLAEFFIRSFCPPNGIVLDPFSGSGTTTAVAIKNGRRSIACDIRESQVTLTQRRLNALDIP